MATILTDFLDPGELRDGELRLFVAERNAADSERGFVPAYNFAMTIDGVDDVIGQIGLRLGATHFLVHYAGQLGYDVDEPHRGHRYAARSCRLLFPLARAHGFAELWITCDLANVASRRTCELAGAELVEIVALPPDCEIYADGERFKCRYRVGL